MCLTTISCLCVLWLLFTVLTMFVCVFQEAKDTKVMDVRIFSSYKGTGIAVLTCSYRIFIVNSIDDLRIRKLAEVPGITNLFRL